MEKGLIQQQLINLIILPVGFPGTNFLLSAFILEIGTTNLLELGIKTGQ
jgi:hypothetical protein